MRVYDKRSPHYDPSLKEWLVDLLKNGRTDAYSGQYTKSLEARIDRIIDFIGAYCEQEADNGKLTVEPFSDTIRRGLGIIPEIEFRPEE